MNQYIVTYLVGTLLGELLLVAWWGMQKGEKVRPKDYLAEKWAQALFSGVFALGGCMLWAEGKGVNLFGYGQVTLTQGWSVAMGMLVCFFAHSIVWGISKSPVGKMIGLVPPDDKTLGEKFDNLVGEKKEEDK